ncbi:centromere/kinetochore protein zw10 homolog isoform X1 [Alligator sinensis]|uniref:Centromere/kinetochore protein zw10 homolog isoform X1 n=1 Tax=Alligator sinensis TaxID=38654 RepID=A0A3Q0GZ62_ALLSI|nr:centromere/kinetochore protein zw10 homolog isoform X1 [Alligator sinensis]
MELTVQTQNMLYQLGEEWQKMVVWKLPPSKELSSLESVRQTELHLCTKLLKEEEIADSPITSVLQAFAILGELHTKIKFFGQLLLKCILKPLISYPSLQPSVTEQPEAVVLRFETIEPNSEPSSPVEVFDKIRLVLEVLHTQLLNVPVDERVEGEKDGRSVLAQVLGDMIWGELSDCLIQDCLVYSIPTNSNKLEQYVEVIKSTEEFEKALKSMCFLKGDVTDLLKYARNINAHFANKKCQDVIVAARNLMTSEIHNTVKITPESSVALPKLPDPTAEDHVKMQKASKTLRNEMVNLENETKLSQHTFSLPACRISVSVERLMELAYQTLSEATASTDQCCIQLFYAVRNIFQLFYDVVPTYHKENLQKLPQLAAIHHNNCMYIAHHLLTLGHQFRYRLTSMLCDGAATFVDLVPGFRRLGVAPAEETGQSLAGRAASDCVLQSHGDVAEHGPRGDHQSSHSLRGHLGRGCRPAALPLQDRGRGGATGVRPAPRGEREPEIPGGGACLCAPLDDIQAADANTAGQSPGDCGSVGGWQRAPGSGVLPRGGEEPDPSPVPEHGEESSRSCQDQISTPAPCHAQVLLQAWELAVLNKAWTLTGFLALPNFSSTQVLLGGRWQGKPSQSLAHTSTCSGGRKQDLRQPKGTACRDFQFLLYPLASSAARGSLS